MDTRCPQHWFVSMDKDIEIYYAMMLIKFKGTMLLLDK